MKLRALVSAIALSVLSPLASADIVASDDFNYAQGELPNTQAPGSGWAGAWTAATAITQVVDPDVDLGSGNALSIIGTSNTSGASTGNNIAAVQRTLSPTFSGNELFVSFLFQLDSGALTNNDFLGLWFNDNSTTARSDLTNRPNIGIKANGGSGTNDIFVRTTGTEGSFALDSDIGSPTRVTYQIVGRLWRTAESGNYSNFDLWLNPIFADLAKPDAKSSGNAGISTVTRVGFRTANLDGGDTLLIDNLILAENWNDVVAAPNAVPEPGSLALAGLALLGLGLARRRRS